MEGLLDFLHDLLPASWFESAQEHFGQGLTDDEVAQSVHEASRFFGMDDPVSVREDWTTGVMTNLLSTANDDVLIFNREQLAKLGITDREGFDMVMTHEGGHRMLQNMNEVTHFNDHQEELCCDYLAGVRAGLNGMDEGKMQMSLAESPESETHPDGQSRVESIENGVAFAHEFWNTYHRAPTFSECLEHFVQTEVCADAGISEQITLSPETDGNTLHGYTQSEINSHISKAKNDIAEAESDIRHRQYMIKSKAAMHEPCSYEEWQLHSAQDRLRAARADLNRWYHEKPDIKNFAGSAVTDSEKLQDAMNRADDAIERAEALADANDRELGTDSIHSSFSNNGIEDLNVEGESKLKEMFVNSKVWNAEQAKWYQEKAKIEHHEAELASKRGDYADMRNHVRLEQSYKKMADQYAKDARDSTK